MKLKIYKRHWLFSITYFVSLMILLLVQINAIPMGELFRKIKYPYVFFVFFLVFFRAKIKKGVKAASLVLFLLFVHTYLFGYVFINDIVWYHIQENVFQMIWFLLFVLVTFWYVAQNNFFKGFIVISYLCCGIQLLVGLIMHTDNLVNPLWALVHAFTADDRYKNAFGFVHPGYTSNACFITLVLSLFFFEIYRNTEEIKRGWFWISFLTIDAIAGLELMAAAERAGILCTIFVFLVYIVFVFFKIRIEKKTILAFLLLIALFLLILEATGTFTEIWGKSNRELNISVNYPLFKTYASPWTGLGFIESAGFQSDRGLFPMPTSSLDMYYVYIYFSTGIIGSIIIGLALLIVLIKLLVNRKTNLNILTIEFYLAMLFYAVWQCNLFTHRYISSYVVSILLLCAMSNDCCLGDTDV